MLLKANVTWYDEETSSTRMGSQFYTYEMVIRCLHDDEKMFKEYYYALDGECN